MSRLPAWYTPTLLALLLVLALGLRLIGLNFGLPLQLHPDEHTQALTARQMVAGDLNPHFFNYPTAFIYMHAALSGSVQLFLAPLGHPLAIADYFLLGRVLSVIFGVLTVGLVFWLGRLVLNDEVGLLAAALVALSPEHIVQSHYALVETALVFWVTLALCLALRAKHKKHPATWAVVALAAGLALGTKYTAVLLLPPLALLLLWQAQQHRWPGWSPRALNIWGVTLLLFSLSVGFTIFIFPPAAALNLATQLTTDGVVEREYLSLLNAFYLAAGIGAALSLLLCLGLWQSVRVQQIWQRLFPPVLATFGLTVGVVFVLSSPFIVLDWRNALPEIFYEIRHAALGSAALYVEGSPLAQTLQPAAFFPDPTFYAQWFLRDYGLIVFLGIVGGWAFLWPRRPRALMLTFSFALLVAFTLTRSGNKAERYALVLVPCVALWASAGWADLTARWPQARAMGLHLLGLLLLCAYPAWAAAPRLYHQFILPDTRTLAWQWFEQQAVTRQTLIVREAYTPDLENVPERFNVIYEVSAFAQHSPAAWRAQGVRYVIISENMRDWYGSQRTLYPEIVERYAALELSAKLCTRFDPGEYGWEHRAYGPTIYIYDLGYAPGPHMRDLLPACPS